jgi:hypothetical protein
MFIKNIICECSRCKKERISHNDLAFKLFFIGGFLFIFMLLVIAIIIKIKEMM